MTEMELMCAVYGEATVFPVNITRGAKVSALQEKIAGVLSTEQHTRPPRLLTLYLARKNDEWLKDDRHVKDFLRGGISAEYEEMRPSWVLADKELFGENFQPRSREIHVLVELPEAAVGVSSETSASNQMLKEMHERIMHPKRKLYTHSSMSSNTGNALLQALNILVEPVSIVTGAAAPVKAFQWERVTDLDGKEIKLLEEQQRERYRIYVERNISDVLARKKLCVLGVEKGSNILSTKVPGHDIDLVGRTDILVLSDLVKDCSDDVQYLPGVRMLIEVKKEVKKSSDFQALSELIALDIRSRGSVMALLTDLNHKWNFFWVSERCDYHIIIHKVSIKEPGEAFQVIRALLEESPTRDADISLPFIGEPVKRRKLTQLLPPVGEGGESGGILEAIERYRDITSLLGRPDIDMARAVGNQCVRSMPAFSMYT